MFSAENPNVHRFCTDSLPLHDRLARWREEFGQPVMRLDFDPLGDEPYWCETALMALPNLGMGTLAVRGASVARTPGLIARDNKDDIVMCLRIQGAMSISSHGRDISLASGDAMLLSYTDPTTVRFAGNGGCYIGLQIPREMIEPRVIAVDDAVMRRIPRTSESLQLLTRYLDALKDWPGPSSPALQHAVVTHVHDLMALTIGATPHTVELAEARGLRAARLESIKKYVVENLHRGELSAAAVAARHCITPRYLHKLFEGEEMSFSRFVLDRRLRRTWHLLKHPRYDGQTITAIAHEAGFNDLSYFNRCFRRRYQATPSSVREQSRRGRSTSMVRKE